MLELDHSVIHQLNSILGWLELGNSSEARVELEALPPELQSNPDLLQVRWLVDAAEENWERALETAKALIQAAPDFPDGWLNQAYALRRTSKGGLQAAWTVLVSARPKFPQEPIFPYNMACYACQLGLQVEAIELLKHALSIGDPKSLIAMALKDPDLEPLKKEIRALK